MRLARFPVLTLVALCSLCLLSVSAGFAQVPIPLQEQIDRFGSLPPAQQQALIRELQRELPPAQRDAVIGMLRQQQAGAGIEAEPDQTEAPETVVPATRSEPDLLFEDSRLGPGDTLVIEFLERQDPAAAPPPSDEQQRIDEFLTRLADGNPYQLDANGQLYLPGVPSIGLAGLDIDQATVRIQTERQLRTFDVILTHLPLDPVGTDALEPFGYDLFFGVPTTFAPATDIPVPVDYVIGPGDTVNVQLFGNQNNQYFLTVSREGVINFPEIGPLTVSGLSFTDVRNLIDERVSEQMIGVRASTTLGELRSIRVFVLGDVERPGSYTVSSLSTMTNALFVSGGVRTIGSLRSITLMRDGETVSTLDLYALLLRGDTRGDSRLQPGDVIFVPPIGATVAVDGAIRRPAIYEIRGESTVQQIITLAGGLNADANRAGIKLERIVAGRGTAVQDINLTSDGSRAGIRDGDVIRVERNLSQLESSVRLIGNVFRPGLYQWYPGMTLSDLLPTPELVKPLSDLNYVLIRRENAPNVDIDVVSADLQAIWERRPGAVDLGLSARDTVYVFNLDVGRQYIIAPIIEELEAQAAPNEAIPIVRVGGQVRAVGEYPLEPGMRVSDLLRAGGGLSAAAYAIDAELTRYAVVNGEYRETALLNVNLAAVSRGDASANVALAPYDYLSIKEVPHWREQETIAIQGQVQFPGIYTIRQGETLSSVITRAGGLTDVAFPRGSVFTREALRAREAEQLEVLARRVETDLAAVALSDPDASDAITTGQTLVNQLRNTQAVGRLVIDLEALVAGRTDSDIVLRGGDQLFVPQITQEVMVLGEVQYSTSHVHSPELGRDAYIAMSGGMTRRADDKRIYVVRANGAVVAGPERRWFSRRGGAGIEPGDTIVVPLDTDRVRPLVFWQGITEVLYNIAVAFSVINDL